MRNMSAWAIRHPISPIVLFVVLLFMGSVAFVGCPSRSIRISPFRWSWCRSCNRARRRPRSKPRSCRKSRARCRHRQHPQHHLRGARGPGQIFIEFNIGTPIDRAVADVRDAVAKVRVSLPEGIQEPIVQRQDVDGGAIVYYALSTTTLSEQELSWFVDNTVTKRLLGGAGRGASHRGRGVSREIRVELDPGSHAGARHHRCAGQSTDPAAQPRLARRPRPR